MKLKPLLILLAFAFLSSCALFRPSADMETVKESSITTESLVRVDGKLYLFVAFPTGFDKPILLTREDGSHLVTVLVPQP